MEELDLSPLDAAMSSIKEELAKDLANAVLANPNIRKGIAQSEIKSDLD